MPRTRTATTADDLTFNGEAFARHLQAENKSAATVASYLTAVTQLRDFLRTQGMPLTVANIRREHVEAFLIDLRRTGKAPNSVANRYRSLQQFYRYLEAEGEVKQSPLRNIAPPKVPDNPPLTVTAEQVRALLRACNGSSFAERRDTALITLLYDTGVRRAEITGLRLADIDPSARTMTVTGKGSRIRVVRYGRDSARALDRYLRARHTWVNEARRRDRYADSPWLWMGEQGPMKMYGIEQAVKRRAEQAGVTGVHLHSFRHGWADAMLRSGAHEGDVAALAGWRSRQMLDRYARSVASERARSNFDPHSPMDRLRNG